MSTIRRLLMASFVLVGLALTGWIASGCQANTATSHLLIWEGPRLRHGRMSANLGAVQLKDGRIVVVGGSNTEYPFVPIEGNAAIEMADASCILAASCIAEKENCQCWFEAGIKVNVPLSGQTFVLPDGRLLTFASVYVFDRASSRIDSAAPSPDEPTSGPVSAAIIDVKAKTLTPIYRPLNNEGGQPSINNGKGFTLIQRAFERAVQLRDGRIVRIGGYQIYQSPTPKASCREERCQYCIGDTCKPPESPLGCQTDEQCPAQKAASLFSVHDTIEIYTPPDSANPLGSVKLLKMDEGRASTAAIELQDGRVLIMGGWGPKGDGPNQNYLSTYFLDTNSATLSAGPKMLFYREDHAVSMMTDGRILITGGTDHNEITVNTSEIFDPKTGIFYPAASMTATREDHIPITLGPWIFFMGGEVNDKADQIRNSAELFDASTAAYIGPIFMFSRPVTGDFKGFAGVTDGAVLRIDDSTLMLFAGQQGLQDRDGEYISAGKGSSRSVLFRYVP